MSMGSKPAQYEQPIPKDLQGVRGQQVDLWSQILGGGQGGMDALNNLFGNMGNPATPLQRQSTNQISQFLDQPAPEQRALDASMPALQGILNGKPGAGIMDALQPHFQQNLAQANQEGGRFGSANAILRSRAVDDYNLLGAQAAQQGQQTQIQAANALQLLSGQAGQNPFARLMGGAQVGQNDANQADQETQRRLQILGFLMGGAQQAGFNVPFVQTQPAQGSPWGSILSLLGTIGGSMIGGPAGGAIGGQVGGAIGGRRSNPGEGAM